MRTNQMMCANVNPGDKICLCHVLAVEELVEIHHGLSRQVHVEHAATARFVFLADGHS
jgi:hypothetical protein